MFNVYREGKVHVLEDKCSTCVFRPGNLMHLSPGRLKDLSGGADDNQTAIICHQTLPTVGYPNQAICRGYWDSRKDTNPTLVLAAGADLVEFDEPPSKEL